MPAELAASSNGQDTTLESFGVMGDSSNRRFGPKLPAALQCIGALPNDGIIVLSFLNHFDSVEFDFVNTAVSFFNTDDPPLSPSAAVDNNLELIGKENSSCLGVFGHLCS